MKKPAEDMGGDLADQTNLTKNQLLIWLDQKSQPNVPLYNMVLTFTISGEIEPRHFQKAFQALINSTDALRIVIEEESGIPQLQFLEKFPYQVEYLDFSRFTDANQTLERWVQTRCIAPFNLAERLFDSVLIKLGDHQFVWYLNVHHLIFDGWSGSLVYRRMSELYECSLCGQLDEICDYPSFREYAESEHVYRRSSQYFEAERYWKKKLAHRQESLTFYGRSPLHETLQVLRVQHDLGRELSEKLRILAADKEVSALTSNLTQFNIFAALVFTYLYRITGNHQLAIGVPFHNRSSIKMRKTVGLLMEVVPIQIEISDQDSVVSLVKKVMAETNRAVRHSRFSPGNPVSNKAYEVVLNFHDSVYPDFAQMPTKVKWLHSGYEKDKLAFQIHDFMQKGSFVIEFDFNREIFDKEQRSQAIAHFLKLADGCLEGKQRLIGRVGLLSSEDQKQILDDFSQPKSTLSAEQTVVRLFEAQTQRTPDHSAVTHEGVSLTYRELNSRANQLAHYLRTLGVCAETLVGLCLERSLEMIVALLGILKAGGAYVPLDPAYPMERLAYILKDTGARVLLTQKQWLTNLPDHDCCDVVLLDSDWQSLEKERTENPSAAARLDNLAYVIYTSGSTGKPKGVMIQHRSLANYTEYAGKRYEIDPKDRALQFASINFDASAEEIYPTLTRGATLFLRNETMIGSAALFLQTCREWGITVLNLPTAYWHELVSGMESEKLVFPSSIRLTIIGGEKGLPQALDAWHRQVSDRVCLMNTYGPTESTIVATMCELTRDGNDSQTQAELAIGSPVGNVRAYVLDSNLQPVPIGVAGELYLGGAGLARGYLNDARLTAERFIPDPFAENAGARFYKTGDLVRWRRDGNVEFVGRVDDQVKIRGFRIELGEIETVINRFPGVQKSLVLAKEPIPNHKRLVAYVVSNNVANVSGKLRDYLKQRLPDYMLPSAFVCLDGFPLTPSGKVDHRSLPDPAWSTSDANGAFEAPRTSVEKALAKIWAQVLRIDRVGLQDNFFELGGDSILSIQVIAKANQAGIHLTIADIIRYQTISELAAVAGECAKIEAEQGVVTGNVEFMPYQRWFFEQNLPEPHHWNMAILLDVREQLQLDLVREAFRHLMAHHDALRLRFIRHGADWTQINVGVDEAGEVPLIEIDLSALPENEQEIEITKIAHKEQASLNLVAGPLMRIILFHLGSGKPSRMQIIVHHMIFDGISFWILLEDFESAYRQLKNGERVSLPAKATSYKHWGERLHEYAQSNDLRREIDYWTNLQHQKTARIPLDHCDGINTWGSTRTVTVSLNPEETQALLQEVPAAYNTQINDVLLTALVIAFSKWTRATSLLFDLEGHGREDVIKDVDLSRTIGCFTALFPVILEIESCVDLGGKIKKVKEALRQIPNHGIGYGVLRYLRQHRDLKFRFEKFPQSEMSFNYLGQFDQLLPSGSPFTIAYGAFGSIRSPREKRRHLIEILGSVNRSQLTVAWFFSENIHRPSSIERVSEDFREALQAIIEHCTTAKNRDYTPSDFPAARIDQKTLDNLLAKINS